MSEEIKEIIRKDYEDTFKKEFVDIILELPFNNLLDYITNLQQQIEEYQKALDETTSEKIDLQQENEFLKLNNPEMNIEHFRIIKENKRKIDNLRKENERLKDENKRLSELDENYPIEEQLIEAYKREDNYKSRIDKAIKYIKSNYDFDGETNAPYATDTEYELLRILKGDDK